MGYKTEYSLDFDTPELGEEIAEAMGARGLDGDIAMGAHSQLGWYDHEVDMLILANMFPDTVFILSGIGDEFPDVWKKRFVNGRVDEVRADIVFPDFPPLKGSEDEGEND